MRASLSIAHLLCRWVAALYVVQYAARYTTSHERWTRMSRRGPDLVHCPGARAGGVRSPGFTVAPHAVRPAYPRGGPRTGPERRRGRPPRRERGPAGGHGARPPPPPRARPDTG